MQIHTNYEKKKTRNKTEVKINEYTYLTPK